MRAEALLDRALAAVVAGDGGVADRSPATQVALIELLLQVRAAYTARGRRASGPLIAALDRLVPALASLVMGDGGVGAWHGGGGSRRRGWRRRSPRRASMARPSRAAGAGGYQRVTGARPCSSSTPPRRHRRAPPTPHTPARSPSNCPSGAERLVVNCGGGGPLPLPPELANGLRTTAAHSTLVLADSNSTRIRPDGALGRGVEEVVVDRHESEEGVWLDLAHDGYVRRFGVRHHRRLFLSAGGDDLRGEDSLEPVAGAPPRRRGARPASTSASTSAPGSRRRRPPTARARSSSAGGTVWQVRARGGPLAVDDSVWVGPDGVAAPDEAARRRRDDDGDRGGQRQLVVQARGEVAARRTNGERGSDGSGRYVGACVTGLALRDRG